MTKDIDNRYSVSNNTEILNTIKRNNKILEILSELEMVTRKLYDPIYDTGLSHYLIYKDREGEEINMYDFFDDLQHFIDRNETYLMNDSKEKYNKLNKNGNKHKT
jgi:hypothetical protein